MRRATLVSHADKAQELVALTGRGEREEEWKEPKIQGRLAGAKQKRSRADRDANRACIIDGR